MARISATKIRVCAPIALIRAATSVREFEEDSEFRTKRDVRSAEFQIVDQGPEFKCEHFENVWCEAHNILLRFGTVGKRGSIAVVERFHRTLKEMLRLITIPDDQTDFEGEMRWATQLYLEGHETESRAEFEKSVITALLEHLDSGETKQFGKWNEYTERLMAVTYLCGRAEQDPGKQSCATR